MTYEGLSFLCLLIASNATTLAFMATILARQAKRWEKERKEYQRIIRTYQEGLNLRRFK